MKDEDRPLLQVAAYLGLLSCLELWGVSYLGTQTERCRVAQPVPLSKAPTVPGSQTIRQIIIRCDRCSSRLLLLASLVLSTWERRPRHDPRDVVSLVRKILFALVIMTVEMAQDPYTFPPGSLPLPFQRLRHHGILCVSVAHLSGVSFQFPFCLLLFRSVLHEQPMVPQIIRSCRQFQT